MKVRAPSPCGSAIRASASSTSSRLEVRPAARSAARPRTVGFAASAAGMASPYGRAVARAKTLFLTLSALQGGEGGAHRAAVGGGGGSRRALWEPPPHPVPLRPRG